MYIGYHGYVSILAGVFIKSEHTFGTSRDLSQSVIHWHLWNDSGAVFFDFRPAPKDLSVLVSVGHFNNACDIRESYNCRRLRGNCKSVRAKGALKGRVLLDSGGHVRFNLVQLLLDRQLLRVNTVFCVVLLFVVFHSVENYSSVVQRSLVTHHKHARTCFRRVILRPAVHHPGCCTLSN